MFNKLIRFEHVLTIRNKHDHKTGISGELHCHRKLLSNEKRLGFLKKDKAVVNFSLGNYLAARERFINIKTPYQTRLKEMIDKAKQENKVFFYQPNIKYSEEHYVMIIGCDNYTCQEFQFEAFLISSNKHFWKIAQNNDLLIKLNKNQKPEIYLNGKPYEQTFFKKNILEYKDLYLALSNCLDPKFDIAKIDLNKDSFNNNAQQILFMLLSDLHLADKTKIDNFGEHKEKALIETIENIIIPNNVPVIIPGDLFELWQTTFENISEAYSALFASMRKIETLILLSGNHDDEIVERKDIYNWVINPQTGILPNAIVLPSFYGSIKDIDIIAYHGDKQDPANNNTKFGRNIAKFAGLLEYLLVMYYNKNSARSYAEQRLEGFGTNYLAPTKLLLKRNIVNYATGFVADINSYIYRNKEALTALSEGQKRELMIFVGHTHDLMMHHEGHALQQVVELLRKELINMSDSENKQDSSSFAKLIKKVNITIINTGSGSGEMNKDSYLSKDAWEKVKELMDKENLTYQEYLKIAGEYVSMNGRQNSVWVLKGQNLNKQENYSVAYTFENYNERHLVAPLGAESD